MLKATHSLEPRPLGVLCRKPLIDDECPEASDVDLVSFWDEPEECPVRLAVTVPSGRVYVDVLWIPVSALMDPVEAAGYRMLPHLLMEAETVYIRSDWMRDLIQQIKINAYNEAVWERRLIAHIHIGDSAFREAYRNLDFPQASLFFLQIAHSYYLMALADCLKQSIMSLLTRPIPKLRRMEDETDRRLEEMLTANLILEPITFDPIRFMKRIYDFIDPRYPKKASHGMGLRTGGYYSYSSSKLDFEYRSMVTRAMLRRGHFKNASIYVRFWAYTLSRCPIVFEEAKHGNSPSFYVPYKPLRQSLEEVCPQIINDLALLLGGETTRQEARASMKGLSAFRSLVLERIRVRGFKLEGLGRGEPEGLA